MDLENALLFPFRVGHEVERRQGKTPLQLISGETSHHAHQNLDLLPPLLRIKGHPSQRSQCCLKNLLEPRIAKQVGRDTLKLSWRGAPRLKMQDDDSVVRKREVTQLVGLLQDMDRDVAIRRVLRAWRDEEAIDGVERVRGSVEVGRQGTLDLQHATIEERSPERL
eukprot:245147-Pyramimonas_sp.AAC.1